MGSTYKTILALSAVTASLFSAQASAEVVEVYLLDRLDGDLNEYCIDINGGPGNMDLEAPIQVHTCYTYRPTPPPPTVDQAMNTEDIAAGKIHFIAPNLCAQVDDDQPGARLSLEECADVEEQSFELRENGQLVWKSSNYDALNPELCLTAGPVSWLGGRAGGPPSAHQIRTLDLQVCGSEAEAYQLWGTRSEI